MTTSRSCQAFARFGVLLRALLAAAVALLSLGAAPCAVTAAHAAPFVVPGGAYDAQVQSAGFAKTVSQLPPREGTFPNDPVRRTRTPPATPATRVPAQIVDAGLLSFNPGGVAANGGVRALPASVKVPLGNSKYGLEHILRRHSFNSLTTKPASKFSRDMGHIEIRGAINDAVARGGTWRVEGSSRVLDTSVGRTIGTDLAGNSTTGIRVVTDEAGSVITSYPIPWP